MKKILVIEDDNDLREMVVDTLKSWGFETEEAENGKIGLEKIEKNRYSLVITDIRMPKLDGLSLLKTLKKHNRKIPVIVITGYPSLDSAVESLNYGADFYLPKPINMKDLKTKINKSLEQGKILLHLKQHKLLNWVLLILIPVWFVLGVIIGRLIR